MTLQLQGEFSLKADGANAALKQSAAALSELKVKELEAGAAARQASQALRELERQQAKTGDVTLEFAERLRQQRVAAADTSIQLAQAQRAVASFGKANELAAAGVGRQRAAYQQLGFQISDVAAQASIGTNPMIIFAQQGGQIAQAVSGFGGVIGRVAAFLAGPWGAAILGAGAVIGVLASKQREASAASDAVAKAAEQQKKALEELDNLAQKQRETEEQRIQRLGREAEARLKVLAATRGQIEAAIQAQLLVERSALRRAEDPTLAGEGGFNPGAAAAANARSRIGSLEADLSANRTAAAQDLARVRAAQFASAQADAKAATDATVAATQRYNAELVRLNAQFTAGRISQSALTAGLVKAERDLEAAKEAASAADKAQGAAARDAKKAAAEAAREAKKAAEEQAKLVESLLKGIAQTTTELNRLTRGDGSYLGFLGQLNAADDARKAAVQRSRDATGLSAAVASAEANIEKRKSEGKAAAEAFNKQVLAAAQTIGDAIGNAAGRTVTDVVEAVLGGQLGNIRGPAGNVIRGLEPLYKELGRNDTIREGLRPLVNQFKQVFGDQPFGQQLGKSLEAAGFGASVAQLIGKGAKEEKIGGAIGAAGGQAIGAATGIPGADQIGKVVGSIIGTAIGGLFVGARTGSVSITGANGQIQTGAAVGTGSAQRRNAESLGGGLSGAIQTIADRLGGSIGNFAVSIGQNGGRFRVDPTGQGRTSKRQSGVLAFGEDADAAYAAALEDAIRDGAITGVSPRVQAALQRYAKDVDKAVSEALKVQDLESFLADRDNPFGRVFRDFERQAADRLKIARQYGFDVVEIERVNAEERAKLVKEQLANTTATAKALLDDIRFGSRAEGSVSERLAALGTERSRLEGLVSGGDTSQIDALAQIIQQQLDLSRQAFGSTGQFAADRSGAISSLETLIRQTEDRINATSAAAQNPTVDKLTELNTTADEQVTELQRQTALLQQLALGGGLSAFSIATFARPAV